MNQPKQPPIFRLQAEENLSSRELAEQAAHVAKLRSKFHAMREWAAGREDWAVYDQALDGLQSCDDATEQIREARNIMRKMQ